jgi:tetratricopeptide (TPR) repeat protein
MDIEESLSQADLYIRQNQVAQARTILGQILRDNPQNEEAWILSAQVSDKPEQAIYCLRQALGINPASRARLLLERLRLPQTPPAPVISSQPESQPLPDTQPMRAIHPAAVKPEEVAPSTVDSGFAGPDDNATEVPDMSPAVPELQPDVATLPSMPPYVPATPAEPPAPQAATRKRPRRWLQRVFTIAASASLFAPWIFIQKGASSSSLLSGAQVLLGPIFSPLGVDVGISSLALLACLVLPLLMFFRFKSAATQKWGERATIALAPLASVLCLDMISFFYAGLTNDVVLRWGIWASCGFYSLAGLTALINARRLGNVNRTQLYAARAGWIFTWLFSFGDILALLVTMVGLVLVGKFSLIGISAPFIWLCLGALLSHIV